MEVCIDEDTAPLLQRYVCAGNSDDKIADELGQIDGLDVKIDATGKLFTTTATGADSIAQTPFETTTE
jgi:hypothetical protein